MSERSNPLQFTWLKRAVVLIEVVLGSLALAGASGLLFQTFVTGSGGQATLTELIRSAGLLLVIGTILFLDGLRRGRRWI